MHQLLASVPTAEHLIHATGQAQLTVSHSGPQLSKPFAGWLRRGGTKPAAYLLNPGSKSLLVERSLSPPVQAVSRRTGVPLLRCRGPRRHLPVGLGRHRHRLSLGTVSGSLALGLGSVSRVASDLGAAVAFGVHDKDRVVVRFVGDSSKKASGVPDCLEP